MSRHLRYLFIAVLTGCSIFVLSCCKTDLPNQTPRGCESVIVQGNPGTTEVCSNPQTIAVLSPPLLDILLTLGLQPAAYAEVDLHTTPVFDRPSEQIPFLGQYITTQPINLGDRSNPSLEALLHLKPDLIIGENYQNTSPLISKIAPTSFFEIPADTGWQSVLLQLSAILGREAQAQSKIAQYDRLVQQTRHNIAPAIDGENILVLGWERFSKQIFMLESDSFICELLRDLGFAVVAGEAGRVDLSIEVLPTISANHILILPSGNTTIESAQEYWKINPLLQAIPAVRSGKVYFVDFQLYRIRGPIAAEILINQLSRMLLKQES
jgi:iron complex transport system substrate-binding protein